MDFQIWLAFVAASTGRLLIPGPTVSSFLATPLAKGSVLLLLPFLVLPWVTL